MSRARNVNKIQYATYWPIYVLKQFVFLLSIGGISAVAKLSVQAPPAFEIKKRTQTSLISENTVLQCEAKGEKPIGILWNMDNIAQLLPCKR